MRRKRTALCAVLALVVFIAVGAFSASAGTNRTERSTTHRAPLVGTWNVTLFLGPVTARVLATFERGGVTVESAAAPGTVRTASHGVWRRIGERLYSVTRVFFRFEQGVYVGTTKVNATVQVAPDSETFDAVSVAEERDPDGNIVRSGLRGTAVGTRMHVEEIPDRP